MLILTTEPRLPHPPGSVHHSHPLVDPPLRSPASAPLLPQVPLAIPRRRRWRRPIRRPAPHQRGSQAARWWKLLWVENMIWGQASLGTTKLWLVYCYRWLIQKMIWGVPILGNHRLLIVTSHLDAHTNLSVTVSESLSRDSTQQINGFIHKGCTPIVGWFTYS